MNLSAAKIRRLEEIRLKMNTHYTGQEKLSRMDRALLQSKYIGCTIRASSRLIISETFLNLCFNTVKHSSNRVNLFGDGYR